MYTDKIYFPPTQEVAFPPPFSGRECKFKVDRGKMTLTAASFVIQQQGSILTFSQGSPEFRHETHKDIYPNFVRPALSLASHKAPSGLQWLLYSPQLLTGDTSGYGPDAMGSELAHSLLLEIRIIYMAA